MPYVLEVQQQPELEAWAGRSGREPYTLAKIILQCAVDRACTRKRVMETSMIVAIEDGIHAVVDLRRQPAVWIAAKEQILRVVDDLPWVGPDKARTDDDMRGGQTMVGDDLPEVARLGS